MWRMTSAPARLTSISRISTVIRRRRSASSAEITGSSLDRLLDLDQPFRAHLAQEGVVDREPDADVLEPQHSAPSSLTASIPRAGCACTPRRARGRPPARRASRRPARGRPVAGRGRRAPLPRRCGTPCPRTRSCRPAWLLGGTRTRTVSVERRYLDRCAEHRLADGDRQIHVEIVAAPLEQRVRPHLDPDEEVARRRPGPARAALAGDANARAVVDAGGDVDVESLGGHAVAGAAAGRARTLRHAPAPAAARARAHERHRTLPDAHAAPCPCTRGRWSRWPDRPRCRRRSDRPLDAEWRSSSTSRAGHRAESDLDLGLDVGPARRLLTDAALAEDVAEDVLEVRVAAEPRRRNRLRSCRGCACSR